MRQIKRFLERQKGVPALTGPVSLYYPAKNMPDLGTLFA